MADPLASVESTLSDAFSAVTGLTSSDIDPTIRPSDRADAQANGALTAFAAIFTVTGGGPGTATEILNLYAYRKSFTELSIGYGSALAVALLVVTILISGVLFALRRAK